MLMTGRLLLIRRSSLSSDRSIVGLTNGTVRRRFHAERVTARDEHRSSGTVLRLAKRSVSVTLQPILGRNRRLVHVAHANRRRGSGGTWSWSTRTSRWCRRTGRRRLLEQHVLLAEGTRSRIAQTAQVGQLTHARCKPTDVLREL